MSEELPYASIQCAECGTAFDVTLKKGRLPSGAVPCPNCKSPARVNEADVIYPEGWQAPASSGAEDAAEPKEPSFGVVAKAKERQESPDRDEMSLTVNSPGVHVSRAEGQGRRDNVYGDVQSGAVAIGRIKPKRMTPEELEAINAEREAIVAAQLRLAEELEESAEIGDRPTPAEVVDPDMVDEPAEVGDRPTPAEVVDPHKLDPESSEVGNRPTPAEEVDAEAVDAEAAQEAPPKKSIKNLKKLKKLDLGKLRSAVKRREEESKRESGFDERPPSALEEIIAVDEIVSHASQALEDAPRAEPAQPREPNVDSDEDVDEAFAIEGASEPVDSEEALPQVADSASDESSGAIDDSDEVASTERSEPEVDAPIEEASEPVDGNDDSQPSVSVEQSEPVADDPEPSDGAIEDAPAAAAPESKNSPAMIAVVFVILIVLAVVGWQFIQ